MRPTPVCNEAKASVELKNSNQLVFSLNANLGKMFKEKMISVSNLSGHLS